MITRDCCDTAPATRHRRGCTAWRKATASNPSGNCVAVCGVSGDVWLRHSRRPDTNLLFTRDEFAAFLAGAKAGEFDDLCGEEL